MALGRQAARQNIPKHWRLLVSHGQRALTIHHKRVGGEIAALPAFAASRTN